MASTVQPMLMVPPPGLPLILASGSRFRLMLLRAAGVVVAAVPAAIDEPAERRRMASQDTTITPSEVALQLAVLKALEVSVRHPEALVIGADQVLACEGEIFSKPADRPAARAQMVRLRGKMHTLPTGVVLAQGGAVVWRHVEVATLRMRSFSAAFLDAYLVAAGPSVTETAGGYMLEGLGAQLFDSVDGDTFTIIGLPLMPLLAALRQRGVLMT